MAEKLRPKRVQKKEGLGAPKKSKKTDERDEEDEELAGEKERRERTKKRVPPETSSSIFLFPWVFRLLESFSFGLFWVMWREKKGDEDAEEA